MVIKIENKISFDKPVTSQELTTQEAVGPCGTPSVWEREKKEKKIPVSFFFRMITKLF